MTMTENVTSDDLHDFNNDLIPCHLTYQKNLSFDMSLDMGFEKVIVVVMEVILVHIFGHGQVK